MTAAFSIRGLTKTYPDFQLGPLNLDLECGTVLGYVGPNGSGKTTTMHCLVQIVKADGGEMYIFGDPNDPHTPDWRTHVGYVGDVHMFYEEWPAEKHLKFLSEFYPTWSHRRVADLIKRFNVPANKRMKELSTGNRVKVSLIAALAYSPHLLLLDEMTSGLDPVVRSELLEVLFEFMRDGERAIFYSTHILSDISRLADELVFIEQGQVKLREAKDDLTERWRKISFRSRQPHLQLVSVSSHKNVGQDHQVISFNHESTLRELYQSGAENVQEHRMGIDEIAVQILKGSGECGGF